MRIDFEEIKDISYYLQKEIEKIYPVSIIYYSADKCIDKITHLINKLSFYGEFVSKNEKERFFNTVLGVLYDEFNILVKGRNVEYILLLLRLLEYNRYLGQSLALWSRNKEDNFIDTIGKVEDDFLRALLLMFETKREENDLYKVYKQFENAIALSHGGIEIAIERLYYQYSRENKEGDYKLLEMPEEKFVELFDLLFIFQIIISLKVQYTIGEDSKNSLLVTQEGIKFINHKYHGNNRELDYFNHITNKSEFRIHYDYNDERINTLVKQYYGLSLYEMNEMLEKCKRDNFTETIVTNEESYIMYICDKTKFPQENVKKFISNMIFSLPNNNFIIESANRCNKASRRCFVDIFDMYIFPYGLFNTAVMNIMIDLSIGDSNYKNLDDKIKAILKERNRKFEEIVFNELEKIPNALIKKNVQNICLKENKYIIPAEIDIVLLFKDIIYIIECKDMSFKTNAKKISNTENKFKKAYNVKLKKKINEVECNKEELLLYMGDSNKKFKNSKIKGLIVTSEYFEPSKEIIEYPTIPITKLLEYLMTN